MTRELVSWIINFQFAWMMWPLNTRDRQGSAKRGGIDLNGALPSSMASFIAHISSDNCQWVGGLVGLIGWPWLDGMKSHNKVLHLQIVTALFHYHPLTGSTVTTPSPLRHFNSRFRWGSARDVSISCRSRRSWRGTSGGEKDEEERQDVVVVVVVVWEIDYGLWCGQSGSLVLRPLFPSCDNY